MGRHIMTLVAGAVVATGCQLVAQVDHDAIDAGYTKSGGCGGKLTTCDGQCVDTERNRDHCGGCRRQCKPLESCVGGSCMCPYTVCNDRCSDTASDAINCGACGIVCKPGFICVAGECASGVALPGRCDGAGGSAGSGDAGAAGASSVRFGPAKALVGAQLAPRRLALDDTHVYWANSGDATVSRVPKAGGVPELLTTAYSEPVALAAYGELLYIAEARTIRRVPTAGGTMVNWLGGFGGIVDVQADGTGVYWADAANGTIARADHGGGNRRSLYIYTRNPRRIALTNTKLYFSEANNVGRIDLARGDVCFLATGLTGPDSLAIAGDELYFSTADGWLLKVPVSGGPAEPVLQDRPRALAADEAYLYYANETQPCDDATGSIVAVGLGDAQPSSIASGLSCPVDVAVDASAVYALTRGSSTGGDGTVLRIPKR